MFGTIAVARAKEGKGDALVEHFTSWWEKRAPKGTGATSGTVYRTTEDPREYMVTVVFESREAYEANADDPAQDAWYQELVELLETEPRWIDGDVFGDLRQVTEGPHGFRPCGARCPQWRAAWLALVRHRSRLRSPVDRTDGPAASRSGHQFPTDQDSSLPSARSPLSRRRRGPPGPPTSASEVPSPDSKTVRGPGARIRYAHRRPVRLGHDRPRLQEAAIDGRFHDLRHTAATLLLSAGVHPKVVSERLGHASVNITLDTYSHILPDVQGEAADAMDRFLARSG